MFMKVPEILSRQADFPRGKGAKDDGKAFPLSLARSHEKLRIAAFLTGKGLNRRLGDLGLHQGSIVEVLHRERSGASIVVHDNTRIAIGASLARMINVTLWHGDVD